MRNDELLAVVKVTEKRRGEGQKQTKNSYVMYR